MNGRLWQTTLERSWQMETFLNSEYSVSLQRALKTAILAVYK